MTYGCPSLVDGSPIGGGSGYLNGIKASDARYVVGTAAELKSALASALSGQIVYLADGSVVTLNADSQMYGSWKGTTVGFYSKPGVTLAGGRSGRIVLSPSYRPTAYWYAAALGANARMSGVIIQGGQPNLSNDYHWSGVGADEDAEVDNCDISGMAGGEAVGVYGSGVKVHHNNLHHNQCTSQSGYGVLMAGSYGSPAIIEANYYDYCKHAIASVADLQNWVFRYNLIGPNAKGGQIDSHGQNDGGTSYGGAYAGNRIEIYNNTSLATNIWFVQIRGIPGELVTVHHNWTYLPESFIDYGGADWGYAGPIGQIMTSMSGYGYNAPHQGKFVKMESFDNWYGTTPPPDMSAELQQFIVTVEVAKWQS